MLYPVTFHPILKERVWGGRKLGQLYRKPLPVALPIGESWEVVDRPGDVSIIANGPLAGKDLNWLLQNHGGDLLGGVQPINGRFPLLIKLLDAREKLSLQVHPPAPKAAELGGEPKTELWYVAAAEPGAEIFVGLRRGVTRHAFEQSVGSGAVAECFHRIPVRTGDTMFLPSGRVHALGAGLVIFEIQQNSDTTYRVYDWGRVGLDGRPRALHIEESLASIDFNDFEPALVTPVASGEGPVRVRNLVRDTLFQVDHVEVDRGSRYALKPCAMQIIGVLHGQLRLLDPRTSLTLNAGQFCLVPASLEEVILQAEFAVTLLRVEAGAV